MDNSSRDKKEESGRIDIAVWREDRCLAVLEIKTKSFSDDALNKHRLYCESPDVPQEASKIFIAQSADGFDLRGFRFLRWQELGVRLRERVPSLARVKGLLTTAMVIAFIAAVEQNVLGVRPLINRNYHDVPTAVTHLRDFLERMTRNEKRL